MDKIDEIVIPQEKVVKKVEKADIVEILKPDPEYKPFDKRYDEPFEDDGAYADDEPD